ncbi:NUDIX hydrolase [Pseudarthrobacter sp. NamE5]|uniref:NUDIX hydrolase n=1 Tax=Pseudarthrobacter sp. NamE5 TaxID=2576839 RepID=UPI00110B6B9D|nr:NUDIX hydrolase [Pseudarthrobacter sp. NamE5]TLM87196.1 NUDIX hydrolase [Pseudarthrobacter sp. NamE5]
MTREIRRLQEVIAYENSYFTVFDDAVEFPTGRRGTYLRIAAVAPGTPVVVLAKRGGLIGLVRSYRYPIGQSQWALPRGFAHGTDVLESALAELGEELGVTGAEIRLLGHVTPDSGLLATRVAVVLARVLEMAASFEDREEIEANMWVTQEQMRNMVRGGEIEDAFTLSALTLSSIHGA